jgi:hypothetical protein
MPEVGETAIWYPGRIQQCRQWGDRVTVKVLRIARNGMIIEVPLDNGETKKIRVGRDWVKAPPPKPYRPRGRPHLVYVNPAQSIPHSPRKFWFKLRAVPGVELAGGGP